MEKLGEFRLLLFEVLLSFSEFEDETRFSGQSALERIFNSTIQIIVIWATELAHNNILLLKVIKFLQIYVKKVSVETLLNAFIKTGALCDFAENYCIRVREVPGETKDFLTLSKPFLDQIIDLFEEMKDNPAKSAFYRELSMFSKWRFAVYSQKYRYGLMKKSQQFLGSS